MYEQAFGLNISLIGLFLFVSHIQTFYLEDPVSAFIENHNPVEDWSNSGIDSREEYFDDIRCEKN